MERWARNCWCAVAVLVAACGPTVAPTEQEYRASSTGDGWNALVRLVAELPGDNCEAGGTAVLSGIDSNDNKLLDEEEVTKTTYTCHAVERLDSVPGTRALLRLDTEAPGINCAYGGTVVRSGLDANSNGILDPEEVTQTQYVCSSAPPYATKWAVSSLEHRMV